MLEPQLSSTPEHVKRSEPTTEGEQMPEMGTRMLLWPSLESRVMRMGKPQLMSKRVQELLRQRVPVLESRCSTVLSLKLKQAEGLRWGW